MVLNNLGQFGGLQEFATNLAIGVQKQGHQVSVFSASWDPSDNQYIQALRQNHVSFIQLPKWVSVPAEEWPLKEKVQTFTMWLFTPLAYLLAVFVSLFRKRPYSQSLTSARNWLRYLLISQFQPSSRQPFIRLFLNWWKLRWRPNLLHIHRYTSVLLLFVNGRRQKEYGDLKRASTSAHSPYFTRICNRVRAISFNRNLIISN
jgi:glycogen synthase